MVDDAELISCIQHGSDPEANRARVALYERYGARLAHYLGSKGLVYEELEDIASQAWLKALESIGRFEDQGVGFFPWLRQIADWVRVGHFRKRYLKDIPLKEEHEPAAPPEDDPAQQVVNDLSRDQIREVIQELLQEAPERYRTVIEGRYFCDMSLQDIMHIEGWTRDQVDSNHFRALKWLKKRLLARYGDAVPGDWLDET